MPEHVIEAPVTALNTSAGSVAPSSQGEINVVPQPVTPAPAPKPGSAKARLFENLRSRAKADSTGLGRTEPVAPAAPAAPPAAPAKTEPEAAPKATEPTEEPEGFNFGDDLETKPEAPPEKTATEPTTPTETAKPGEKPKVSPWKLVDEYKDRVRKSEQELLELKKLIPNEEARKKELADLAAIRKRNDELEKEIERVAFTKSKPFQEKFEKPYTEAWNKAIQTVTELMVTNAEDGSERPATANDIMDIINLPTPQARRLAQERFGDDFTTVMEQRSKIREVYEARNRAIEEQSQLTAEQQKEQQAKLQQLRDSIASEVRRDWDHYNNIAIKDKKVAEFFNPPEGDADAKASIENGFKFFDKAMAMTPMDPRLTPEQRKEAVQLHAAIRVRSAAFGRLTKMVNHYRSQAAKLEAELKQYRSSEPTTTGGRSTQQVAAPVSAHDAVMQRLRSLAK